MFYRPRRSHILYRMGWVGGLSLNDLIRKSVRRQETEPLNQRWADAARLTEALSGTTAV